MSTKSPTRKKPGRRSTVATHPERAAIELDCARGVPFERVAEKYGVSRMAIHRHWHGLPEDHRVRCDELADAAARCEARVRATFACLAARPMTPAACRRAVARVAKMFGGTLAA